MEDGSRGGNDGASSSSSSALLTGGGRQRFQVELRPGETTIVSWKKLVKDANKAVCINKSLPKPALPVPPTVAVNQTLDSLNAPHLGESAENEANDAPHGSRFGAVIEKIERLYMGKNSSDEEDLNDVPDDDEYDTKDSFIDDAELDEYFQVDDSAIKHDGFFVNRGKLERTTVSQNEPTALPSQQPKKRRKDSAKVYGGNDDGQINNIKVNNNASGKVVAPVDKNITISSQSKSSSTINVEDIKYQDPTTALETVVKKSLIMREKNVICDQSKAKVNEITPQTKKNPLTARKEGSYTKPKSTMLEKAIRDLEKIVVISRPPSMEVADADTSSQAVKRRMPPEIKQKLAKVARLAHAMHGKISKELLNRLMNIVGHLIQLRSLRRNLKNMVNMGLSAKEEKDVRMQQLKKQIDEMVKIRAPIMKSKFQAMGQQVGASDDFQETGGKEKEVLKRRITMDDTLEDKICDLYDLFSEGLDEDSGHQVRKLYAELAELWPNGFMDNHGIRRAICRAKDRRKALHRQKDQEKLKRKKIVATKTKTVELEAGFSATAMRSISNTLAAAPIKPNNESGEMLLKKGKRKPETELCEAQIRQEKTSSAQAEERHKFRKQIISTITATPQTAVE